MHVRCDNQYKTGADGKYFRTVDAVWVHGYLRFEPGSWKWNKGLPWLCAKYKIFISLISSKFSHRILDLTVLSWNWREFLKTFLEGSMDHIIYRDYIVNRRSFIHCSLTTFLQLSLRADCVKHSLACLVLRNVCMHVLMPKHCPAQSMSEHSCQLSGRRAVVPDQTDQPH